MAATGSIVAVEQSQSAPVGSGPDMDKGAFSQRVFQQGENEYTRIQTSGVVKTRFVRVSKLVVGSRLHID